MSSIYGIHRSRIDRYSTPAIAQSAAKKWVRPCRLILGDDDRVWVVSPADAERLIKTGLEYLPS